MPSDRTHASFFSGVGGLDMGLERAGWRTVSFSEIDPYASAVLAERWPGVPNLGDIVQLAGRVGSGPGDDGRPSGSDVGPLNEQSRRGERAEGDVIQPGECASGRPETRRAVGAAADREWHRASLWTGGFPCQDLSVAGKRRGMGAGTRSGLAYAFLDLVGRHYPRFVLLENVPGLLSSHGGRDMAALIGALVELGYGVGYRVLDARYFGVPQRRRRVFILGDSLGGRAGAERAAEVLSVGSRCRRHPPTGVEAGEGAAAGAGERASWLGGHGSAADGADSTRTLGAAMGHHGYTMGAQDADGGYLQVSPTVTGKWAKGSGGPAGSEEGNLTVVPAILAGGGRLGHGDKDQHIVLGSSPDPDRMRASDGLAGRSHDRDGLADTLRVGGRASGAGDSYDNTPWVVNALDQRRGGADDNEAQAGHLVAVAQNQRGEVRTSETAFQLTTGGGKPGEGYSAVLGAFGASGVTTDPLLPLGLDSNRYRCCGNGVVSDVSEWIGLRLAALA